MPAPTLEQTHKGYAALWDEAVIKASRLPEVNKMADLIIANRETYEAIEALTGVPWFWQGPVHNRESSLSFQRHIHEGSPLTARTKLVPKGRPKTGTPPFTFQESAVDAFTMEAHRLDKVKRWSVERCLYEQERYNGFGYVTRGVNSPYVWAATSEQQPGKYVADGVWDPRATDVQLGTAALMKALADKCPDVASRLGDREAEPPQEVFDEATKKERRTTGGAAAAGGAGGASTQSSGTVQPDDAPHIIEPVIGWTVFGIGIAVAIVAAVLWARKVNLIKSKWGS